MRKNLVAITVAFQLLGASSVAHAETTQSINWANLAKAAKKYFRPIRDGVVKVSRIFSPINPGKVRVTGENSCQKSYVELLVPGRAKALSILDSAIGNSNSPLAKELSKGIFGEKSVPVDEIKRIRRKLKDAEIACVDVQRTMVRMPGYRPWDYQQACNERKFLAFVGKKDGAAEQIIHFCPNMAFGRVENGEKIKGDLAGDKTAIAITMIHEAAHLAEHFEESETYCKVNGKNAYLCKDGCDGNKSKKVADNWSQLIACLSGANNDSTYFNASTEDNHESGDYVAPPKPESLGSYTPPESPSLLPGKQPATKSHASCKNWNGKKNVVIKVEKRDKPSKCMSGFGLSPQLAVKAKLLEKPCYQINMVDDKPVSLTNLYLSEFEGAAPNCKFPDGFVPKK